MLTTNTYILTRQPLIVAEQVIVVLEVRTVDMTTKMARTGISW